MSFVTVSHLTLLKDLDKVTCVLLMPLRKGRAFASVGWHLHPAPTIPLHLRILNTSWVNELLFVISIIIRVQTFKNCKSLDFRVKSDFSTLTTYFSLETMLQIFGLYTILLLNSMRAFWVAPFCNSCAYNNLCISALGGPREFFWEFLVHNDFW